MTKFGGNEEINNQLQKSIAYTRAIHEFKRNYKDE